MSVVVVESEGRGSCRYVVVCWRLCWSESRGQEKKQHHIM